VVLGSGSGFTGGEGGVTKSIRRAAVRGEGNNLLRKIFIRACRKGGSALQGNSIDEQGLAVCGGRRGKGERHPFRKKLADMKRTGFLRVLRPREKLGYDV